MTTNTEQFSSPPVTGSVDDTPRTDAEIRTETIQGSTMFPPHHPTYKKLEYVRVDFARCLEIEIAELNQRLINRTAAYEEKDRRQLSKIIAMTDALEKAEASLQFWMEHNRDAEVPMHFEGQRILIAMRAIKNALK